MLTPIEIQGKTFKGSGMGYQKTDVDSFFATVSKDYEDVYKENIALKEKVNNLTASLAHYQEIEKSLQKALVLAETTAEETVVSAKKNAVVIEQEAVLKAQSIVADAKVELEKIKAKSLEVKKQYESYKAQYKALANAQLDLINSDAFQIEESSFENMNKLEKDAAEHVDHLAAEPVNSTDELGEKNGDMDTQEEDFDEELSGEEAIIKDFSEIFDEDSEDAGEEDSLSSEDDGEEEEEEKPQDDDY